MPKPIHSFITKLAAVESSKPDEWYVDAIVGEVRALLSDAHDVFDVPRLVKSNGLQELIKVT
ncbi:MAG: hypothetical protein ABSF63_00600 [Candidatus Bathyarchaeia archaeon]|jgi:hypothetical protein